MEFPLRLTNVQRALALVLLAPVLWTARLEYRSPLAAAVRQNEPWACWLGLKAPDNALPQLFLAYYRPGQRTLDLVYVAENIRLDDNKTLPQLAAAARKNGVRGDRELSGALAEAAQSALIPDAPAGLRRALASAPLRFGEFSPDQEEPPLAARDWLLRRLSAAGFLRGVLSPRGPGAPGTFERLREGLEFAKLSPDQLRAAYLPDDPTQRAAYFTRLEEPGAPPAVGPGGEPRPTTVEILNATQKSGIANDVKKILRSRGADVMSTGNAPERARTLVVDRVGRPELAARVRKMLDCPSAQALTQVDEKRLVDVSVVIADDCAVKE